MKTVICTVKEGEEVDVDLEFSIIKEFVDNDTYIIVVEAVVGDKRSSLNLKMERMGSGIFKSPNYRPDDWLINEQEDFLAWLADEVGCEDPEYALIKMVEKIGFLRRFTKNERGDDVKELFNLYKQKDTVTAIDPVVGSFAIYKSADGRYIAAEFDCEEDSAPINLCVITEAEFETAAEAEKETENIHAFALILGGYINRISRQAASDTNHIAEMDAVMMYL